MKKIKSKKHRNYIIICIICISLIIGKIFQKLMNTNFIIECLISLISAAVLSYIITRILPKNI